MYSSGNHGRMADNGKGGRWIWNWRKGTYIFCDDEYVGSITQKFETKELGVNWLDERELGTVVCIPYFKTDSRQVHMIMIRPIILSYDHTLL